MKSAVPQTCCLCRKAIKDPDELCYLTTDGGRAYYHHLVCGHVNGWGEPLVPELELISAMLRITGTVNRP